MEVVVPGRLSFEIMLVQDDLGARTLLDLVGPLLDFLEMVLLHLLPAFLHALLF